MEYCGVQGIFDQALSASKQQFDIHQDGSRGLVIGVLHEGYVGYDRGGTGPAYQLLDLRVQKLVPYILQGLEGLESPSSKDIKCALEAAFQRVDKEVRMKAKELEFDCPPLELETRLNSRVVVVHGGFVYVAGAADARTFLARDSKELYLTSSSYSIHYGLGIDAERAIIHESSERILFYFHQERLQATDAYLVMASYDLWVYFRDSMLPVLQSRIDAVGLDEACKSIAGPYPDGNKILVVITLQPGAHKPKSSSQPVDEKLLSTMRYDIELDCYVNDPLSYLLPFVNGKEQHPIPVTSCLYYGLGCIPERRSKDEIEIVSSKRKRNKIKNKNKRRRNKSEKKKFKIKI